MDARYKEARLRMTQQDQEINDRINQKVMEIRDKFNIIKIKLGSAIAGCFVGSYLTLGRYYNS
jgi:hypothetical protein